MIERASNGQVKPGVGTRGQGLAVESIVGISPWAVSVRARIEQVAEYSVGVLVTGPTGTGKELLARAIQKVSPRRDKPFVPIDCASMTGTLFASQIFGHKKGAFTGAHSDTLGCFRAAEGGTVFLDEIGEMDLEIQAKLLRVLQQRTVVPVGSYDEVPVDVRIIAATNRDLKAEVEAGRFREDLFYRLNVVTIHSVALRERPDDIPVLANHFIDKLAARHGLPRKQLSSEAINCLLAYDWSGNIRQLENVIEGAVLFSIGETIGPESLDLPGFVDEFQFSVNCETNPSERGVNSPGKLIPSNTASYPFLNTALEDWPTLAALERDHIVATLERTFYNQTAAADILGLDRTVLRRRIAKYGLETQRFRRGRRPSSR